MANPSEPTRSFTIYETVDASPYCNLAHGYSDASRPTAATWKQTALFITNSTDYGPNFVSTAGGGSYRLPGAAGGWADA